MAHDIGGTGAKVLLIEDHPLVADLIRDVLEMSGYRVWRAEDGRPRTAPRSR